MGYQRKGIRGYQLLGGKTNDKLRAYARQIQFDWGPISRAMITTNDYADATRRAIADGYDCIKVDPVMFDEMGRFMHWNNYGILRNEQLRIAVARIAAIRKAGGPDLDIIIELHGYTDTNTSIQLGRELEQFRCFYYEDPTQPLNPNLFKEISDKVKIPIASG